MAHLQNYFKLSAASAVLNDSMVDIKNFHFNLIDFSFLEFKKW